MVYTKLADSMVQLKPDYKERKFAATAVRQSLISGGQVILEDEETDTFIPTGLDRSPSLHINHKLSPL